MLKIRTYKKDLEYSYVLGVFPLLELLKTRSKHLREVILPANANSNQGVNVIIDQCSDHGIPVLIDGYKVKLLSAKENTHAVGVFDKYQSALHKIHSHVVLVEPSNMGNLGGIIRSMVAFGVYNLAIIRPAADIFDPKVISASMGAFFHINFEFFDSLEQYVEAHGSNRKLYSFYLRGAQDIRAVDFEVSGLKDYEVFQVSNSFIFGNEASGLSEENASLGQKVMIPQFGDVDSLNLHVSVSVALWEVLRRGMSG